MDKDFTKKKKPVPVPRLHFLRCPPAPRWCSESNSNINLVSPVRTGAGHNFADKNLGSRSTSSHFCRRRTLISSDFCVVLWTLHRSDGHQVLSGEDIAVEAKKGQEVKAATAGRSSEGRQQSLLHRSPSPGWPLGLELVLCPLASLASPNF